MRMVYTTCGGKREAARLSKVLVEKKLCACAVSFPIQSMYWWNGRISQSKEYALFFKTTKQLCGKLERALQTLHSYEIPCVLSWDVEASSDFLRWATEVTK